MSLGIFGLSFLISSRLHEVGLFTAVKQEGNYETGQVCQAMMDECQKYIRISFSRSLEFLRIVLSFSSHNGTTKFSIYINKQKLVPGSNITES